MAGEHHESDGIAEAIDELLRAGVLLGTRLAERRTRAREQALREAAARSLDDARAEQERQHAARQQAMAQLEGVFSGAWWDRASAEDIRGAWTTARSYQHEDARAARGVWTITHELRARHGLDAFEVDPAALGTRAELERRTPLTSQELDRYARHLGRLRGQLETNPRLAEHGPAGEDLNARRAEIDELRDLVAEERTRLAEETTDPETAEQRRRREQDELERDLTLAGGAGEDLGAPGYDTRQRRVVLAQRLTALDVDPEAVRATVLADAANAHPPEMATAAQPAPASRARVSTQSRQPRQRRRTR